MLRVLYSCLLILLISLPAAAEELAIGDGLVLGFVLPEGWAAYTEPPVALIEETAEHVEHEAKAADKHPSPEQIRQIARKRLLANEEILYHAASGTHLDIDFSRLEAGEEPPSSRTLKKSAEFAAESLSGEEGVSDVQTRIVDFNIAGAEDAYRLDATYKHHEEPVTFIGIIGYTSEHWFFFYCTAPGQDQQALDQVELIFKSLIIRPASS